MTEDQRVARNPGEPGKHDPPGAARWSAYLDWMRAEVIDGVLALSEAERRTSRVASGWTPIEMLSHVLHMEERWFVWGFLGEPVADPWGDWNTDEPWLSDDSDTTRPQARWQVADEVSAEQLADRLRAVGERTREVLTTHPLEARASTGGRFAADPPTLEWICFHVLAEYARHAGHVDIAVELTG